MKCTHEIYLHFCFNELVQGSWRFCRKCKKPSFPSKSVNLDVPNNFEKKMSQCKIKKYLEKFSLTDPPWPTVLSTNSLSTIPEVVRFINCTKSANSLVEPQIKHNARTTML